MVDSNVKLLLGDCLDKLKEVDTDSVDLIYLDPPFYTQTKQSLKTRDNTTRYSFDDSWESIMTYKEYIEQRLQACYRVLKDTGSLFLHCDKNASHYLRMALDEVFGAENFRSEIIWSYKRWSNSKKGLLNNHQNIYFYSKTKDFKFNAMYTDYSPTTNIDQILQKRTKDKNGKTIYKKDEEGYIKIGDGKKGVPLSDIWELPYLNPKAKERVGYPTQKPILLLERIITLVTDQGDRVLDPFMGSGTTGVAAVMLNRKFLGMDISQEALMLAKSRISNPIKSDSNVVKKGKESYRKLSEYEIAIIKSLNAVPVQRNGGIDGFLKENYMGQPVSIRIQRQDESLQQCCDKLIKFSKTKRCSAMFVVMTEYSVEEDIQSACYPENLFILQGYDFMVTKYLDTLTGTTG